MFHSEQMSLTLKGIQSGGCVPSSLPGLRDSGIVSALSCPYLEPCMKAGSSEGGGTGIALPPEPVTSGKSLDLPESAF